MKQVMEPDDAIRQIAGLVEGEELTYFVGNLALERYIEAGDSEQMVSVKRKIAALATLFYQAATGHPCQGVHRIKGESRPGQGTLVQRRIKEGVVGYVFVKGGV
jgi:hypothetical protein